jgi:hypothetical protein
MLEYLQKRSQIKGFGFRRWPSSKFYKEFGLYAFRNAPPTGVTACASGLSAQWAMLIAPLDEWYLRGEGWQR